MLTHAGSFLDQGEQDEQSGVSPHFLLKEEDDGSFTRYVHDGLGRLVEVQHETPSAPETVVQYGYDTAGRLAWRKHADEQARVWYVRDRENVVVEISDEESGSEEIWANVWAGRRLVRSEDENGKKVHLHHDGLGSIVVETRDEYGTPLMNAGAAYDPYGRNVTLPDWEASELTVPYGFTGARFDSAAAADLE